MLRKPVVNGQFYPADKKKLTAAIGALIPQAASKISAKGLILPHAGYAYSGAVAAATVAKVLPKKRLIILGNNHSGLGTSFALWSEGEWETPFGSIKIDEKLAKTILERSDLIKSDCLAHVAEHSIEVQLPIVSYCFGEFQFVPIACRISSLEIYREVAEQLFEAVKNIKNEILMIATSDLTHYEPDSAARRKDSMLIESIINLDEGDMLKKIKKEDISACGEAPVAILISCLKKMGAKKSQVIRYQTSADTSGDATSVVGYAGIVIN